MDKTFKEILADIKCGKLASPVFTEADLANVKLCLPEPTALPVREETISVSEEPSCVNDGVEAARKIIVDQLKKMPRVIEASLVKSKIEEALDHYNFILRYYQRRVDFFTSTISQVEPFTAQHVYWDDEYNRLLQIENNFYDSILGDSKVSGILKAAMKLVKALSDDLILVILSDPKVLNDNFQQATANLLKNSEIYKEYVTNRINRINAGIERERAKQAATKALSDRIDKIAPLGTVPQVRALLNQTLSQFSGQLIPEYYNSETTTLNGFIVPAKTLAFGIRLIDLNSTKATIPVIKDDGTSEQVERTVLIKENPILTRRPFDKTQGTYCLHVASTTNLDSERNYDFVEGSLYNRQPNGYAGLYRKLANPISLLFTPEERGLSFDPNQIDPLIRDVEDAPVSIKEGEFTLYIKSQAQYERFFETLNEVLPEKIRTEKEIVFPQQIAPAISALESIATREVADFFRQTTDVQIKLARPVSYRAATSEIFSQGEFKYSELDAVVSGRLAYYIKAVDQIKERINDCLADIENLNEIIKQNSMDPDLLSSKISAIPCFQEAAKSKATNPDCEAKTLAKLGTDPLFIRTLDGTDSKLPDMNNPCYWREFAKSLNKVSLLPFPDLTSQLFRYYPINNIIPIPSVGIAMIPLPQKWKPLFSLSTPLGTIVTFLTMPVAIVGIPLPSIYIFYFAPDGRKYLLLAPNIPLLYPTNALKYGFEVDDSPASQNPLGINSSDPYKGQLTKGSLSSPVTVSAASSKAARLASVAAKVALGEPIPITTRAGDLIGSVDPLTYTQKYLSMNERVLEAADFDPAKDFNKQINEFRRNINRQFDRLGEMQITAVSELKEKTRKTREANVRAAENESNLKAKREAKKKAREIDPISLNDKISSILSDFEKYIDKIKLGTIKFPDDPTKLNPKLPGAITGLQPILEQATKGSLIKDRDSRNLTAKLRKMAAQINLDSLKSKKNFNLNNPEDIEEFKKAVKEYSNKSVSYLTGESSPVEENLDPNLTEAQKKEIARAAELRKKRIKQALAFTSLSIATPKLKLFDPAAPCCSAEEYPGEGPISPQILALLAVFNELVDAVLSGLTADSLKSVFGNVTSIGISSVSSFFDSILLSLPPLILPEKGDILTISQAVMVPVLSALHMPQAPNPLGIPFPSQISIPLDAIIKPVLKAAIAYLLELVLRLLSDAGGMLLAGGGKNSTNDAGELIRTIPCGDSQTATVSTTAESNFTNIDLPGGISIKLPKIPMIPLDIVSYFSLLTSTDLVELIRGLILAAVDGILKPLKDIITPILSSTKSLKDLSFNIIEAANPFILPLKLAIMAIQLQIPNSIKLRLANLDAINAIRASYLPTAKATEPVLKEVAYLGALAACAFGSRSGVQIARIAANPFFNQDDLPPWERLTHKNPLFAIFLDEIAWRTSLLSTGSLIFRTKMPGIYPASLVVNVTADTGKHLS